MSTTPPNDEANTETTDVAKVLSHIHRETHRHDTIAEGLQQRRWRIGWSLVILGPTAVLASTAQFVWDIPNPWGFVFVSCDVALLLAALAASLWHFGGSQHRNWIRERLCTEILRREGFLFSAAVGPYLDPGVPSIRVNSRLETIGRTTKDLVDFVPMVAEQSGRTWRDELEDSRERRLSSLNDLATSVETYLKKRVEDQKVWFANNSAKHAGRASWFERIIKGILLLAVAIALIEFGFHIAGFRLEAEKARCVFYFGIFMTMSGVIAAGLQALLENERLSRSYAYHSARLDEFASRLRELESDLALGKSKQEVEFRFKRIVLEVEGMFSEELMQWRLVMEPRAPRADA